MEAARRLHSGQEFIAVLERMPSFDVDCVVLDVQLPGLNGLEVNERLAGFNSRLPVIFITGLRRIGRIRAGSGKRGRRFLAQAV